MTTFESVIAAEARAEEQARLERADRRRILRARMVRRWPQEFQVLGAVGIVVAVGLAWGAIAFLAAVSVAMLVTGSLREAGLI